MAENNEQNEGRIRELEKFAMFTDTPGTPGKRSRLVWGILNGNPRISVFTNVPSDQQTRYGIIGAPMDPPTMLSMLRLLEKVARGQLEKFKMDCLSSPRDKDGKISEIRKISEVFAGRNAEGVVWLSVVDVDEKRPKIVFEFRLSKYHRFYKPDGSPFTDGEASQMVTIATVDALKDVYQKLTTHFRPAGNAPQAKEPSAQSSTSYSKPATSGAFDDISF